MTNMELTKVYSVAVMLPCRWTDRQTWRCCLQLLLYVPIIAYKHCTLIFAQVFIWLEGTCR